MQKYINNVQTLTGDAVEGATIVVKTSLGVPATVYSDNSGTVKSTITTDVKGMFEFYAADGRYNLSISGPGIYPYTLNDIQIDETITAGLVNAEPVANVAAIRSLSKLQYGTVSTFGYYAKGDGGKGDYYYDSTDTTSTDNGGSVIVAADGGRWKLTGKDGKTNVKQWGARGDGSTDDTTPIANCISYMGSFTTPYNGGEVFFPSGIYPSGEITLPNRVVLVGEGIGATIILLKAGANSNLITCPVNSQLNGIRGMTLDGNKTNNPTVISGQAVLVLATDDGNQGSVGDLRAPKTIRSQYSYDYFRGENFAVTNGNNDGIRMYALNYDVRLHSFTVSLNDGKGLFIQGTDSFFSDFYAERNGISGVHCTAGANKF
jgi:hypothetical protein